MTSHLARRAGLAIPLFSFPSTSSWGIGDIGDLAPLTAWLASAGQRILQLLPLNEMAPGQSSPYSAISSMAIDPIFICVPDIPEFAAAGGEPSLSTAERAQLAALRQARQIDYASVRHLKYQALRAAFARFLAVEWRQETERARELRVFVGAQSWWLEDYALFRAIHAREGERPWTEWPAALRDRTQAGIDGARRDVADEVLFYEYLQWTAASQWERARQQAHGVALFGDLPFMVDGDSADVWVRRHQFRLDVSIGVPPDAFSETGQDWGMPLYRWDAMAADDFLWLRERARRSADLYHGYRINHLVGFYRTYGRPRDGAPPFFTPSGEAEQVALGERLLAIFREPGVTVIAEDLGTVPDFVRASLARLSVPGFQVFRWERHWHSAGQPFLDPADYPPVSVATSGTHDTEAMAVWWKMAPAEERQEVAALPTVRNLMDGQDLDNAPYNPVVRDALLQALFAAGSDILLFPLQDVFGWSDRINEPATIGRNNWTYLLPWPSDRLDDVAEARERQQALRGWTRKYER